jgi:hypothetical protein
MTSTKTTVRPSVRAASAVAAALLLVAGCVGTGAVVSQPPAPSPSTPATPTPGTTSADGFYLRAWQTQALAPKYTFGWLPVATISGGQYIDGIVAVPMIYPGPLWVGPSSQKISPRAIDAIVAEARQLGLLGTKSDFTGAPMPGSMLGHIELVAGGTKYELTGSPAVDATDGATPAPSTPAAFAAFWNKITGLAMWLPDELGQSSSYEPTQLAVLALPPTDAPAPIKPTEVAWPLATPFAQFGTALGTNTYRCAVVSGADLAKLGPVVKQANQLTRFVDGAGTRDSLVVRVLVPGEPSPCA